MGDPGINGCTERRGYPALAATGASTLNGEEFRLEIDPPPHGVMKITVIGPLLALSGPIR
jgi:hypothetical protein